MTAFTRILNGYDLAHTLARPGARQVAWLTGQSSYRSAHLSLPQHALLRAVGGADEAVLAAHFPYNAAALRAPYAEVPLLRASLRNGAQFVAALGSPAFRRACARHLQPLLDATTERLVLLCGSCGLQLFYAALPLLRVPPGLQVQLVGLGPVCLVPRAHPQVTAVVVQGHRDWLSRALCRLPCTQRVAAGHLDYAALPGLAAVLTPLLTS